MVQQPPPAVSAAQQQDGTGPSTDSASALTSAAAAAAPPDGVSEPRPGHVITLISRRNKRFLQNEPEIVAGLLEAGGPGTEVQVSLPRDCVTCFMAPPFMKVATLERMPLYEQVWAYLTKYLVSTRHSLVHLQIRLFRRTTLLVGVHGSGLINTAFMRAKTALLQIMPYKVHEGKGALRRQLHYHLFRSQEGHRFSRAQQWALAWPTTNSLPHGAMVSGFAGAGARNTHDMRLDCRHQLALALC
jgi:hypothetical protein